MSAGQRVAVVVFVEFDGDVVDTDAEIIAKQAVENALAGEPRVWPADLSLTAFGQRWSARAVRCMEVGMAAGNGYLWIRPTSKAFLEGRR